MGRATSKGSASQRNRRRMSNVIKRAQHITKVGFHHLDFGSTTGSRDGSSFEYAAPRACSRSSTDFASFALQKTARHYSPNVSSP